MQIQNYLKFWKVGGVLLISLLFWQCDKERWWGYHFEAIPLVEQITVEGRVVDLMDGDPVAGATVRFEDQETVTNSAGYYRLIFYLTADFQRNKPVTIQVEAEDYLPLKQHLLIEPIDQQLDFALEYAAPILIDAIRHVFENGIAVIQVKIMDYQNDVRSVKLTITYTGEGKTLKREFPMFWVAQIEPNLHIYQVAFPSRVTQNFVNYKIGPEFGIIAQDVLGFQSRKTFFQRLDSNPPLFIPYQPDD